MGSAMNLKAPPFFSAKPERWEPDWYHVPHMREHVFIEAIEHGPGDAVWGRCKEWGMICLQDQGGRKMAKRGAGKRVVQLFADVVNESTLELRCTTIAGMQLYSQEIGPQDGCADFLLVLADQLGVNPSHIDFLLEDGRVIPSDPLPSMEEALSAWLASIAAKTSSGDHAM
eukprot:TRINITY_DN121919_c0_g1_i1.p1 TRINITY_DN121919_c0_g1~~TRINITY_DN121919_c0_g1_i1.p1  ORF type:complete len:171 (-),score=30.18 TRINITY_DN121919_c0_g1_i1:234-746(-)